ncbi:arylesterase [Motiliproteus coralliicola]|nr:arylesterase [Motiliproteus coralliicola]
MMRSRVRPQFLTLRLQPLRMLSLLLTLLLSGCGESKLEPLPGDATILAFGDSLTVGVGTHSANSYPKVLEQLSGVSVINAGVSGETTDRGLARLPQLLDQNHPELLILIEGGNDILRNHPQAQIKANLKAMIELADNRGIPTVLIGVPQKSLFSDSAPLYRELAEEYQLVFDGEMIADLLRSPSLKSDPIHLNRDGYRQLAQSIYALLQDEGAF